MKVIPAKFIAEDGRDDFATAEECENYEVLLKDVMEFTDKMFESDTKQGTMALRTRATRIIMAWEQHKQIGLPEMLKEQAA